jgi:dUTP pyrophosphatase
MCSGNCSCDDGFSFKEQLLSIKWAKKDKLAIIPTKEKDNAGYDIYMLNRKIDLILSPFETKIIETGIATELSEGWHFEVRERGSTGFIGLKVNAGIIDNNFRDSIKVMLYNANPNPIIFCSKKKFSLYNNEFICYDINKGIAQLIPFHVPIDIYTEEIDFNSLSKTNRNVGMLGSSGK